MNWITYTLYVLGAINMALAEYEFYYDHPGHTKPYGRIILRTMLWPLQAIWRALNIGYLTIRNTLDNRRIRREERQAWANRPDYYEDDAVPLVGTQSIYADDDITVLEQGGVFLDEERLRAGDIKRASLNELRDAAMGTDHTEDESGAIRFEDWVGEDDKDD